MAKPTQTRYPLTRGEAPWTTRPSMMVLACTPLARRTPAHSLTRSLESVRLLKTKSTSTSGRAKPVVALLWFKQ